MNGGYNASYIMAAVSSYLRLMPESTPEYLERLYNAGKRLRVKSKGLDEVFVWDEDSGRYDTMSLQVVASQFPDFVEGGYLEKKRRREYKDNNPDDWAKECIPVPAPRNSGEANNSLISGASSSLVNTRSLEDQSLQRQMEEFSKLSKTRRRDILKYRATLQKPNDSMPGLAQQSGQPRI